MTNMTNIMLISDSLKLCPTELNRKGCNIKYHYHYDRYWKCLSKLIESTCQYDAPWGEHLSIWHAMGWTLVNMTCHGANTCQYNTSWGKHLSIFHAMGQTLANMTCHGGNTCQYDASWGKHLSIWCTMGWTPVNMMHHGVNTCQYDALWAKHLSI